LNIFIAEKSVGGRVKKSLTSSFFSFARRLDVEQFSK